MQAVEAADLHFSLFKLEIKEEIIIFSLNQSLGYSLGQLRQLWRLQSAIRDFVFPRHKEQQEDILENGNSSPLLSSFPKLMLYGSQSLSVDTQENSR